MVGSSEANFLGGFDGARFETAHKVGLGRMQSRFGRGRTSKIGSLRLKTDVGMITEPGGTRRACGPRERACAARTGSRTGEHPVAARTMLGKWAVRENVSVVSAEDN